MHGAWCVGLVAGDNYVTAGSQRVAQGEIDNFDVRVRVILVTLSLEFSKRALSSLETGA
jgi:hypothetical protein